MKEKASVKFDVDVEESPMKVILYDVIGQSVGEVEMYRDDRDMT
jgi:hypothetical protein